MIGGKIYSFAVTLSKDSERVEGLTQCHPSTCRIREAGKHAQGDKGCVILS